MEFYRGYTVETTREFPADFEPDLIGVAVGVEDRVVEVDEECLGRTIADPSDTSLQPLVCQEGRQVRRAAGVAPLVVVPADDLDHVAFHRHRR